MRLPITLLSSLILAPLALSSSACRTTKDSTLRLRKVVLYQNGIGYFEHSGKAVDDKLQISVRRSELDDALKTLTIVSKESDGARPRHGTVHTMTGDDAFAKKTAANAKRSVPMRVEIPDAGGEKLRVSYSVPTPIWKATYRVVFDSSNTQEVLLQGWAAIQNTSGHDWKNIGLTLATGAPLSFGVNLTRPTYARRPDLSGNSHPALALGAVQATSMRPGDRDGDGIIDVEDLCPDDEEDLDNFEDADGCPELDNDQDRILDVDDECPGDGETYNGHDDNDGCPDRGRVIVSESAIQVLSKIMFTRGSTEITPASEPILDAIAATLLVAVDISLVEIQGHTAANEKDAFTLAEDRALAVAAYLVKAGVASSRFQIRSYGDSNPIDAKATEEAHAYNRRVEFLVLEREEGVYHRQELAKRRKPQPVPAKRKAVAKKQGQRTILAPTTSASGGMVHYALPMSVTIGNGESTLVPLINAKVEGEEIYLFRPDKNLPGSKQHPSRAVRVVNTGALALVPGPIAVFARDAFAGEGLLGSLHPSESAFIPFALDSSSRVQVKEAWADHPKNIISVSEGSITVVDEHELTTEYTVSAGLTPPKRVYVQHHTRVGFELTPPPESEFDGVVVMAPVRLVRAGDTTLRLRERSYDSRKLSLEYDSIEEVRSYMEVAALPSAQAKEIARILQLRTDIELAEGALEAKRSQRFDDRVRASEIRRNLKALTGDQGKLRSSLKRELGESAKRGRRLASEVAVLSETITKEKIEFQALLASFKYKSAKL